MYIYIYSVFGDIFVIILSRIWDYMSFFNGYNEL